MKLFDYSIYELSMLDQDSRDEYVAIGLSLTSDGRELEDLQTIEWGKVKEIQGLLHMEFDIEAMAQACNIIYDIHRPDAMKWNELFPLYNFIIEGLVKIEKLEERLKYEPSIQELSAGIEEFNQFGIFVTIDRLAVGDPLRYDAITKLPYNIIFSKLLLNLVDANFQKKYQEIINNQNKH